MARFQRGSLRVEPRKKGDTWVLRYFVTRPVDGRRVENKLSIGLVRDFPTENSAWEEVQRQHLQLQINRSDFKGRVMFADLARHYIEHELGEQTELIDLLQQIQAENAELKAELARRREAPDDSAGET